MKLTEYLSKHDIDAKAFSEMTGIPHVTIWRIITGKNPPKLDNLVRIEKATHGKVTYKDFI